MKNTDFNYLVRRLADEMEYNSKMTKFINKKVDGLVNEVVSLKRENIALKEENDILKKYAALLLGEYGYNTQEGLNRVIGDISRKEKVISDWNEEVAFEKEVGEI